MRLIRACAVAGLLTMAVIAFAAPTSGTAAAVPTGGRSWELITPSEPVDATIADALGVRADGRRVVFETQGTLPDALGGDVAGHSLATRTDAGWQSKSIGGTYDSPEFDFLSLIVSSVWAISPDFSSVLKVNAAPPRPEEPDDSRIGLYRWTVDAGLGPLAADFGLASEGEIFGASDDISRIVFGASEHIVPSDAGRLEGSSMYVAEGSTVKQVDVDTNGELLSACGSSLPLRTDATRRIDGVSSSGDRIYFVNPWNSECGTPSRVFLRESDGTTTEVSASQCSGGGCGVAQAANFAGSNPSGSVAFLTTAQRLTNADENAKSDLYRFDAETGALELVSPGSAGMAGEVPTGQVRTSVDGSVVYFYAQGPLLPGQGVEGWNLYVAGPNGIQFIGPVGPGDRLETSANGRFAAFEATAALVPADADSGMDVYVFDEVSGDLTIASQGPGGAGAASEATMRSSITSFFDLSARHPFSDDGSRVVFETTAPLVPEDQNGVLDVYEWHAGDLGLISSGTGTIPARFAAASPDGETVVFRTGASLLPRDRDGGDLDLYAARPGGGFAEAGPAPPECERSCSPPAATRIERPVPASATAGPRKRGKIKLRPIGESACRDLLDNGRLVIAVVVPEPGRVSAVAVDRIDGKRRSLLHGVAGAVEPGAVRMHLVAAPVAKAELKKRHRLRVRLVLRQGARKLVRGLTLECGQ